MIVLITAVVFVWVPKPKMTKDVSSNNSSVIFDRATPVMKTVPSRRTKFVDWGRNPFTFPQREENVGSISNLRLLCIIEADEGAQAFINESIVRVGDKITDKTVKRIEKNKVILTDGTKDYVLYLK